MKQLYYTACREGRSVGGASGFQVRAVTPGVPDEQMRAAVAYVGYKLPSNVIPSEETAARAPVRLALLETPNLGRVLVHSVYVGEDPETHRDGNFFSHLLLGVPPDLNVGQVIRTWGSPFWRHRDDDGDTALPALNEPPPDRAPVELDLRRFLADEANRKMLQYVLEALLLTWREGRRIFLAAPAHDVACCVYGVTRALPASLTRTLTFSTYEHTPLSCFARVVGTCWEESSSADLPSSCYSGSSIGYNRYRGRKTELANRLFYPQAAVAWLAGKEDLLKNFLQQCCRLGVEDAYLFELAFRIATRNIEKLSKEDTRLVLDHAPLGKELLKKAAAVEKVVNWALEDAEYHMSALPRALGLLAGSNDPFAKLTDLNADARRRLKGWLAWHSFLQKPSLHQAELEQVADVLSWRPADALPSGVEEVVRVVGKALHEQAIGKEKRPQPALESVLQILGPTTSGGAADIFRSLCRYYQEGGCSLVQRPGCLLAVVAVGLGESRSHTLANELGEVVVEDTGLLLQELKTRGGQKCFRMLRNHSRGWSPKARRHLRRFTRSPWRHLFWAVPLLVVLLFAGLIAFDYRTGKAGLVHRAHNLVPFVPDTNYVP